MYFNFIFYTKNDPLWSLLYHYLESIALQFEKQQFSSHLPCLAVGIWCPGDISVWRTVVVNNFPESWNPWVLWVGRSLKNYHGQGHPPPAQLLRAPSNLPLNLWLFCGSLGRNFLNRISINSVQIGLNISVSSVNTKIFPIHSLLRGSKWSHQCFWCKICHSYFLCPAYSPVKSPELSKDHNWFLDCCKCHKLTSSN